MTMMVFSFEDWEDFAAKWPNKRLVADIKATTDFGAIVALQPFRNSGSIDSEGWGIAFMSGRHRFAEIPTKSYTWEGALSQCSEFAKVIPNAVVRVD